MGRPKKDKVLSERIMQAVRGSIGVQDNESDSSQDKRILAMHPYAIVRNYFGWHLGDKEWGDDAIRAIEQAYGIKLERIPDGMERI